MCGPGLVGYLKCHTMLAMHMFGDTLFGLALQLGTISLLQCSKRCSWKSATACARNFSWARNRNVWNLIIVLDSLHFNQYSAADSTAVAPAKHFASQWIESEGGATVGFWRAPRGLQMKSDRCCVTFRSDLSLDDFKYFTSFPFHAYAILCHSGSSKWPCPNKALTGIQASSVHTS